MAQADSGITRARVSRPHPLTTVLLRRLAFGIAIELVALASGFVVFAVILAVVLTGGGL